MKRILLFNLLFFTIICSLYCQRKRKQEINNENFIGVRSSKGIEKNLFPIKATGVSTKSIKKTAEIFLDALDKKQRSKTQFSIQDNEWFKWSNVDNGIYKRQGISIKEMTQDQRKKAFSFMQACLSLKGFKLSKDIMKTDQTLRELNNGRTVFDEDLYFFTIMGTPSLTQPWGWQIDGHHLAINYFILGDQVVMTPTFMGGRACNYYNRKV